MQSFSRHHHRGSPPAARATKAGGHPRRPGRSCSRPRDTHPLGIHKGVSVGGALRADDGTDAEGV